MAQLGNISKRVAEVTVFALLCAGCGGGGDGDDDTPSAPPEPPKVLKANVEQRELEPAIASEDLGALVSGNTAFALELFGELGKAHPNEDVAVGPYSISQAMAMLYAGARGSTATEMAAALHFSENTEAFHPTFNALDLELLARNSDILLRNANRVWVQDGFQPNPEYLNVLTGSYGAPAAALDFSAPDSARGTINGWVSEVTERKIPELFPAGAITGDTVLVLTNAMYMDAPWKQPFNPSATSPAPFKLLDGSTIDVSTMRSGESLLHGDGPGWAAVQLPYAGDQMSMLVVVPTDLRQFEAGLTPARLDEILGGLDSRILVWLPRFTFNFHTALQPAFRELGLGALFDQPNLSGIAGGLLRVDSAEHEAFIEVDESGTRAAAATGVGVATVSAPAVFSVDRPFLFFIIDKPTHSVLFLGRVLDPR